MTDLTREKILAMEAGREMDAIISVVLFNWTNVRDTDCREFEGHPPDRMESRLVPRYSQEIAAAWLVVEWLQKKFSSLELRWG